MMLKLIQIKVNIFIYSSGVALSDLGKFNEAIIMHDITL